VCLPTGLLPSGFSTIYYMHSTSSPFVLMPLPSHPCEDQWTTVIQWKLTEESNTCRVGH
jgi:hypothetical protein